MPYFVNGVLVQSGGKYRLIPSGKMSLATHQGHYSERKPAPDVEGNTRIASLNVLNLFNGDGKQDIIMKDGWFEQPATLGESVRWPLQRAKFTTTGGVAATSMARMPSST